MKSIGGNRLKIEETDGSEDEEDKENDKRKNSNITKPIESKIEPKAEVSKVNKSDEKQKPKTRIKISEIASDDDDENIMTQSKNENKAPKTEKFQSLNEKKIVEKVQIPEVKVNVIELIKETQTKKDTEVKKEPKDEKEVIVKKDTMVNLPLNLNNIKEKAFEKFTCGQYGEASDLYTASINLLNDILSKTSNIYE